MALLKQTAVANQLLGAMSAKNFAALRPHLERLDLPRDLILLEPQQRIAHAYFVESGIVSVVAQRRDGQLVEAGIYGREGFGGVDLVLAADRTSHQNFVQVAGCGFRIESAVLVQAVRHSTALHELLLHYARIFMIQVAQTALSNGNDAIVERLARWLLMCNDRIDGDIPMTHNFLVIMLGCAAPVCREIFAPLRVKIIRSKHGRIEVRDRAALERLAGVSYGLPEAEYRRLIGSS